MSIQSRAENFLNQIEKYPNYESSVRFKLAQDKYELNKLKEEEIFTYWKIVDYLSRNDEKSIQFFLNVKNRLLHFYSHYDLVESGLRLREEIKDEKQSIKDKIQGFDLKEKRILNPEQYLDENKKILDFLKVRDAIYRAYEINWDNIFGGVESQKEKEILSKEFGFTKEEIKIAYNTSPIEENKVAWILCYWNGYKDNLIPYVNHWHHLLDHDFRLLSNDSIQELNKNIPYEKNRYFQKLREIYWLEFGHMAKNNKIPFWISW